MDTKKMRTEGFINANGIKLQYLDWGGFGPPLVLIHGLGDTPYIFEDLASALHPAFRVVAYARRGHAESGTDNLGYDNAILTSDLKHLLDSLKIVKANLLGWSMGGNEITMFATQYPDRTSKLIFLEAGYDYSEDIFKAISKNIPTSAFPDKSDLQSLDAYRKWYHHFWFGDMAWNSTLEANLRASTSAAPDGHITTIPNETITKLLFQSLTSYHREYEKIAAPALTIYTSRFFHSPTGNEKVRRAYEDLEKNIVSPWRQHSINRIQAELKNITVKRMTCGSHASILFLCKKGLIETITHFLSE